MKIALVLNDDYSMWHFRGGLIRTLVSQKPPNLCDVSVIVPFGPYVEKIEALGVRCICVPMKRFVSPFEDLKLFVRLYRIFKRENFDIVHTMTIKPNIFGTLAAKCAGTKKIVCLISGLGFMLAETSSVGERIRNAIAFYLYRIALLFSDKTWVQNPDDLQLLVERGILKAEKGIVIRSGGINTKEFALGVVSAETIKSLKQEMSLPQEAKCVVMITARLIWSKGVREFVETACNLNKARPEWFFILLSPRDEESPDSVPEEYLRSHRSDNLRVITTFRPDVKTFLALADIVVLPSYYREGVPRVLLEAMAMNKPIITADTPGCREVVKENQNGHLVAPKNLEMFTKTLLKLIDDSATRNRFGENSRLFAEQEFSEEIVVGKIMKELYGLPQMSSIS